METEKFYDLIVIGFGGVGSATLYHAAKKGWSVLGIDQFGPAHNKGSSHGQTRTFRQASFENPAYGALATESLERWDELNKRHRTRPEIAPLFEQTGLLQISDPQSDTTKKIQSAASERGLKLVEFSAAEIQERLPLLNLPSDQIGVLEPEAGLLRVDHCVAAHLAQAKKRGAEFRSNEKVESWSASSDGVEVTTNKGTHRGARLAVCAGAWTSKILAELGFPLTILAKQQHWFQIDRVEQKLVNKFPVVFIEQSDGEQFYCVPELDSHGMKVCRHTGGDAIDNVDQLNRDLDKQELSRVEEFMDRHIHHRKHRLVHHSMCMYANSPDGDFIIDRHPVHDNVAFASGLSGHGFRFTPVLGNRIIEMLDGVSHPELEFLSLKRFK